MSTRLRALTATVPEEKARVVGIDLWDNKLTRVPEELLELVNLKGLYLNRNRITALPSWIGQLTTLEVLDLYSNHLATLPGSMKNLKQLRCLYLNGNMDLPQHLQESTWRLESTQALLQDIAAVAEQRYEKVRSAVTTWMLVAKERGVVRDIRLLIGSMLWSTREDVIWERRGL